MRNEIQSVPIFQPQDITLSQSRLFSLKQENYPGFQEIDSQLSNDNPFKKYIGVHIWHQYIPAPPCWIVDGILHINTIAMMDGQGASGKSLLAQQLAICVASGAPWLAFQVKLSGHVIYLNAEDPDGESHRRYLKMLDKLNLNNEQLQRLQNNLTFVPMGELDDIDSALVDATGATTNTYSFLKELVNAVKPVLVIVDPLIYFTDGNENDSISAKRLYSALKSLKTTVLLLHHMSKAGMNNETSQRAKARGSSVFTENARTRMSLENRILTIDKNNYGKLFIDDDVIKLVLEDGFWRCKTQNETIVTSKKKSLKKQTRLSY